MSKIYLRFFRSNISMFVHQRVLSTKTIHSAHILYIMSQFLMTFSDLSSVLIFKFFYIGYIIKQCFKITDSVGLQLEITFTTVFFYFVGNTIIYPFLLYKLQCTDYRVMYLNVLVHFWNMVSDNFQIWICVVDSTVYMANMEKNNQWLECDGHAFWAVVVQKQNSSRRVVRKTEANKQIRMLGFPSLIIISLSLSPQV